MKQPGLIHLLVTTVKLSVVLTLLPIHIALAATFEHAPWDALLGKYVAVSESGSVSQVDYGGFGSDRQLLKAYLNDLARVSRDEFERWSVNEQLAFLINAYNAWTVELVLSEYPGIESIRDIGFLFSSPWKQPIIELFGEQVSLDDVEHGMIRGWGRYNEPRIHFAVNCAAIGCPALRAEAYVGERLEQQLQDSTEKFLSHRSRNRFERGRLYVSRIFDWYEEDFERGWNGIQSVEQFLAEYSQQLGLNEDLRSRLLSGEIRIRYLRYDWGLNQLAPN